MASLLPLLLFQPSLASETRDAFAVEFSGKVPTGLEIFKSGLTITGGLEFLKTGSEDEATFEVTGSLRATAGIVADLISFYIEGGVVVTLDLPETLKNKTLLETVEAMLAPFTNSFEKGDTVDPAIEEAEKLAFAIPNASKRNFLQRVKDALGIGRSSSRARVAAAPAPNEFYDILMRGYRAFVVAQPSEPDSFYITSWLDQLFHTTPDRPTCDNVDDDVQLKILCYSILPAFSDTENTHRDAFFWDRLFPNLKTFLSDDTGDESLRPFACEFCDIVAAKALQVDGKQTALKTFLSNFYAIDPLSSSKTTLKSVNLYGVAGITCEVLLLRAHANAEASITWSKSGQSWTRTWEVGAALELAIGSWSLTAKIEKTSKKVAVKIFQLQACFKKQKSELPDIPPSVKEKVCALKESEMFHAKGKRFFTSIMEFAQSNLVEDILGQSVLLPEKPSPPEAHAEEDDGKLQEQIVAVFNALSPVTVTHDVCMVLASRDPSKSIEVGRLVIQSLEVDVEAGGFKVGTEKRTTETVQLDACKKSGGAGAASGAKVSGSHRHRHHHRRHHRHHRRHRLRRHHHRHQH